MHGAAGAEAGEEQVEHPFAVGVAADLEAEVVIDLRLEGPADGGDVPEARDRAVVGEEPAVEEERVGVLGEHWPDARLAHVREHHRGAHLPAGGEERLVCVSGQDPRRTCGAPSTYQPMPQPCGCRCDWKRSALSALHSGSQTSKPG